MTWGNCPDCGKPSYNFVACGCVQRARKEKEELMNLREENAVLRRSQKPMRKTSKISPELSKAMPLLIKRLKKCGYKKKGQSEFGEGLVQQLCYFAQHFQGQLSSDIDIAQQLIKLIKRCPTSRAFLYHFCQIHDDRIQRMLVILNLSQKQYPGMHEKHRGILEGVKEFQNRHIWIWFNGASGHFYGLDIPKRFPRKLKAKLQVLKNKALRLGHGFNSKDEKKMTYGAFERMKNDTYDVIRDIDKFLGVKSCPGRWR